MVLGPGVPGIGMGYLLSGMTYRVTFLSLTDNPAGSVVNGNQGTWTPQVSLYIRIYVLTYA